MKHPLRTLVCVVTFFGISLSANAAPSKQVVANINGKELSKEDFDRRYKENIQIFKFSPPTKANVLSDIITYELAVQEAKKMGLDKNPTIQERMNKVLYEALIETQLSDKFKKAVEISEKEARDYCRRNPAVKTSHIYVALKPAALKTEEDAALKKIKEAQAALKSGTPFEKVVAKYSEGLTTATNGDIGTLTKVDLDPVYYMEARKLSVGSVSEPVRSQLGYHIIKLNGVQDCSNINIPEWQRMVFDEKRVKITEEFFAGLKSKAKVSINKELIKE